MAGLFLTGLAAPAAAATVYQAPLRKAVRSLAVAAENNTGYDRTRYFGGWIDANRDCQNTRQEVLIQESRVAVGYTSGACTASTGRWVTTWDNRIHTSASTVQIDHTVPVHEAWGSGARYWTQARRVAFYNDLSDTRSLNAQTSALNSAKQASVRGLDAAGEQVLVHCPVDGREDPLGAPGRQHGKGGPDPMG